MGGIAPKMVELTDNVLYGDVWERPQLSKRDRSLATVSALVAMNRPDQLRSHLALARRNGVTEEELVEAITHLAFYAGWPNAVTAIQVAKEGLLRWRRLNPNKRSPSHGLVHSLPPRGPRITSLALYVSTHGSAAALRRALPAGS
jgi:4-carboxymuconolactone decarboxylase